MKDLKFTGLFCLYVEIVNRIGACRCMPRHFSKKGDLKKFNRRKSPCQKRTMRTRRLLEDIQAEAYLCLMEKKSRKKRKRQGKRCFFRTSKKHVFGDMRKMKGRVNELKQIKSKFGRFGRILSGFLAAVLFISGGTDHGVCLGDGGGRSAPPSTGDRYVGRRRPVFTMPQVWWISSPTTITGM